MHFDLLKLTLDLLDQIAYWVNYKIYFGGPDHLALPLGLIAILAVSLLVLLTYGFTERFRRN